MQWLVVLLLINKLIEKLLYQEQQFLLPIGVCPFVVSDCLYGVLSLFCKFFHFLLSDAANVVHFRTTQLFCT